MVVIKEAIDEAVKHGVPAEAASDFILGHINVDIGIVFGYVGSPFSDGALLAIERGKKKLCAARLEDGLRTRERDGRDQGDHQRHLQARIA